MQYSDNNLYHVPVDYPYVSHPISFSHYLLHYVLIYEFQLLSVKNV